MLKTYISLKLSVKATFIALKLQISFCQDSWQNIGERPSIQTQWHELFQPASMDAFELEYNFVHVRAFTYILSWVLAKWYLQF